MYHRLFHEARLMHIGACRVLTVLGFYLAGTMMELFSLVMLLPVFQYIQADGDTVALAAKYWHWQMLNNTYALVGLSSGLGVLLCTSFIFLIMRQVFYYVRMIVLAASKERSIAQVRCATFDRYLYAETSVQDRAQAGSLVSDMTTDLRRAADYLFGMITLAGLIIIVVVYVCSLFALSVPMTLTALVVFGIVLLALRSQLAKSESAGREVVEANQGMSAFLVERLKSVRLIRLAGMEDVESNRMHSLTERQRSRMIRLYTLMARINVIVEPLVIGAAYSFIFVSVSLFGLRIEQIGLFLVIVLRLLPVVKEVARTRHSNRATRASFEMNTKRLAELEAAEEAKGGGATFSQLKEGIRFEDIHFAYETRPDAPALRGIDVEIPAGSLTALVGPSGAGKSTLIDLLPRIRRPASGRILFDGQDIDSFNLASLRAGIAYAPQMPQVFNVPLMEHIRYGKADATEQDIRWAATVANATEFIEEFPDGFATLAGDGGSRLSGGQRQRLDLARALVRRSPILLLDEPTSNLDATSEALFRDSLEWLKRETSMIIIIIAHRLSTVAMADQIVVMQEGRVVAADSHERLREAGGWYADALDKQNREQWASAAQ